MKTEEGLLIFFVSIFAVVPFFLIKHFAENFILVPFVETVAVFFVFIFLSKACKCEFGSTLTMFSIWYLIFKAAGMSIYLGVGNDVIAYFFITGFFWINFTTRGIKNIDRMYWLLWFIVGLCFNIILSLLF